MKVFESANGAFRAPRCVIHNGIRLSEFGGRRDCRSGGALLGAIMNLSPDKDFDTLLRGLAPVFRERPDVRLAVIGEGPSRRDVERQIAALGLSSHVELLGFRRDVPELLRTFDLLVHSTRTEGLGLVILEAMASGVPVVASAVGGIPEIVCDGVTGRLFPGGDVKALRAAVLSALTDEKGTAAMADAALADVRRRFSVESMCDAYCRLYENA
jgi:glycosyltransferase involved in cell wall biosynthesis